MDIMNKSNDLTNSVLDRLRSALDLEFFESNEAWLLNTTNYAVPIAALIGFIIGLTGAVKAESFLFFLGGLAWVLLMVILYYCGTIFLENCKASINNNPSYIVLKISWISQL